MYGPIKDWYMGKENKGKDPTMMARIFAGIVSGGIAITFANPAEVVKVRMQAQGRNWDKPKKYAGTIDCYAKIYAAERMGGFYSGYAANVTRNSVFNAIELVTYDTI